MDLVRIAGIAVGTAYKIIHGKDLHDLDTLYKVYQGLRHAGYSLEWETILNEPD